MNPTNIAELMLEKKASDIKIFDVKSITTITDYFIMCSANSEPQSKAICDNIERSLRKKGMKPINIEGKNKFESLSLYNGTCSANVSSAITTPAA